MSDRATKINQIIEARKPMATRVERADVQLANAEGILRGFTTFIPDYANRVDEDVAHDINSLVPEANNLIAKVSEQRANLSMLASRFIRDSLNIGVVGRARQGKSTLLQSLTGLSTNEIPTGDRGACTGAPSIVQSFDGETHGEIKFHTQQGFLTEVIAPFFHRLRLGEGPSSLQAFAATELLNEEELTTTEKNLLERLALFQSKLKDYQSYLGKPIQRITQEEIRNYVAQVDQNNQPISTWIAVKQAKIFCSFPHEDVGQIALADTPGLGDFTTGAEERLVSTVGRNLDAVLFVRRPPVDGAIATQEDTDLYHLISGAIPLPVEHWTYFVVNRDELNDSQIPFFEEQLAERQIKTRAVYPVNCINPEEAASKLLDPLLDDLAANLGSLDAELFKSVIDKNRLISDDVETLRIKANEALPTAADFSQESENLAIDHFENLWTNLRYELDELVQQYRDEALIEDEVFLEEIKRICDELRENSGISIGEIERVPAKEHGSWMDEKTHELRVRISNSFIDIDRQLESSFEILREKTLAIFLNENSGRLANTLADDCHFSKIGEETKEDAEKEENNDSEQTSRRQESIDAWNNFASLWSQGLRGGEVIKQTIIRFLTADLTFRGFIQPRIRECLNVLDRSTPESQPYAYRGGDTPEIMEQRLENAWFFVEFCGWRVKWD